MSACTLTTAQLPLANWKKKKKQQKLQASISKVKPELRIAKSLENPQREKEERNEPRTKYLRAEFYEKD